MGDRLQCGIQRKVDCRPVELAPDLRLAYTAENNLFRIKHADFPLHINTNAPETQYTDRQANCI